MRILPFASKWVWRRALSMCDFCLYGLSLLVSLSCGWNYEERRGGGEGCKKIN